VVKRSVFFQRLGDDWRFASARLRARTRDDCQFRQHQGNVFDEHGVCKIGCRVEAFDDAAGRGKALLVLGMLRACKLEIDGHARLVRQLTPYD